VVTAADDGFVPGSRACIGVRPEAIALDVDGDNAFSGTLDDEIYLGESTDWRVRVGGEVLTVSEGATTARGRRRGDTVRISFPAGAVLRLADRAGAPPRN
jgi:ABC-type Fe3+/spermidine/putrescine transport system ATPase subunit